MDTAFPSAFATGIGNSLNKTRLAAKAVLVKVNSALKGVNGITLELQQCANGMPNFPCSLLPDTEPFCQIDR